MLEIKHECENCKNEPTKCFCEKHLELIKEEEYQNGHTEGYDEGCEARGKE